MRDFSVGAYFYQQDISESCYSIPEELQRQSATSCLKDTWEDLSGNLGGSKYLCDLTESDIRVKVATSERSRLKNEIKLFESY